MDIDWVSRQATPDDGKAIVALFAQTFQEKCTLGHWEWKYLNNPTHKMYITIAEHQERIVGQCALSPVWMNLRGAKVMGAQRTDSMIHPDYRKQGMFVSLAKECYAHARVDGVKLLYHFPNNQSYALSVERLSTHKLGEFPQLATLLNPKSIIERRIHSTAIATLAEKPANILLRSRLWKGDKRPKPMEQLKIKRISNFDERFDDLWAKIKDGLPISLWKDSSYLNWRYISCPDREYIVLSAEQGDNLSGFIVLSHSVGQSSIGRIVDFLFLPGNATAPLLLLWAGLDFLKSQGTDIAVCHIFKHSLFYDLFKDCGFFKYGDRLPLLVRVLDPDLPSDNVLDLEQWHLMEGDVDVF